MTSTENKTVTAANNNSNLLNPPVRHAVTPEAAQRMAARCTDYNGSRSEARNLKCTEFSGIKFKGEDFSGAQIQYSKFTNCSFEECDLSRLDAQFAEFSACTFTNCIVENCDFSFAKITDTLFLNSNLGGSDFPMAQGNFSLTGCKAERMTANNADLQLIFSRVYAAEFEANCAKIELDVTGSSLRRSEFNDSTVSGKIVQSDLTGSEFNRADLAELEIIDCATHNMETEDSSGDMFDNELEEALNELEEGILEE